MKQSLPSLLFGIVAAVMEKEAVEYQTRLKKAVQKEIATFFGASVGDLGSALSKPSRRDRKRSATKTASKTSSTNAKTTKVPTKRISASQVRRVRTLILNTLKDKPEIRTRDFMGMTGIKNLKREQIRLVMQKLRDEGIVKQVGERRSTIYRGVMKKVDSELAETKH